MHLNILFSSFKIVQLICQTSLHSLENHKESTIFSPVIIGPSVYQIFLSVHLSKVRQIQ